MAKKKPPQTRRDAPFAAPPEKTAPAGGGFLMFRETVESIVVAFVLAFLFRTFEAEAFVIPTGSMSPSLQGRHKDVVCLECGYRFRTTASSEDMEDAGRRAQFTNFHDAEVVGGMCPMCRYPMPYSADLPEEARREVEALADVDVIDVERSYPGDRILVNKYGFDFGEPQRWDVVVFKFPGDGEMNYIKRLVGLPGEELRVYQGDVFRRPLGQGGAPFVIERKPTDKVDAMLQTVHDSDYESATLYKADWPLRWAAVDDLGWQQSVEVGDRTVAQSFSIDQAADSPVSWLRYRHQVADQSDDWAAAVAINRSGSLAEYAAQEGEPLQRAEAIWKEHIRPQLITDFNSYNARIHRGHLKAGASWTMDEQARMRIPGLQYGYLGLNWVGDLAVECDVEVVEARGQLLLDVVEAGYHFQVAIDLASGAATLGVVDGRTGELLDFAAEASTSINSPGTYRVRLANVDDQLHLWVDGKPVPLANAAYDPDELFAAAGGRRGMIPWASGNAAGDQGDLAPAGVGARGANLKVTRLALFRDVYYIAANEQSGPDAMHMDYDPWRMATTAEGRQIPRLSDGRDLFAIPDAWPRFLTRRSKEFPVKEGQLFVMGDNSPESADCRLWAGNDMVSGIPGGRYLDRRLLIGKALCVFWPHSWGHIPGLSRLPGWPNFRDMRLVR